MCDLGATTVRSQMKISRRTLRSAWKDALMNMWLFIVQRRKGRGDAMNEER